MRSRMLAPALLTAAVLGTSLLHAADSATPPAPTPKDQLAGIAVMAHQIVNDALIRGHDYSLPLDSGAVEAAVLLQYASQLQPNDHRTLKLLVEAAKAANLPDIQRDALKRLIKMDPGDLVAQVAYLDLIAASTQAIDERAAIYSNVLNKKEFDAQIRSEMALRLARIAQERGEDATARAYYEQAIALNDLNIPALRELARMAGPKNADRMTALIRLLAANPYQPEAWQAVAHIFASADAHTRAADCYAVAIEQFNIAGAPVAGDIYLEFAEELATAGRRAESYPILANLVKLPDAPPEALAAMRLLLNEYTPPAPATMTADPVRFPKPKPPATKPATTGADQTPPAENPAEPPPPPPPPPKTPKDLASDKLRDLIDAQLRDSQDNPAIVAGALWLELAVLGDADETATRTLDRYAKLVPADDVALIRFKGWLALRQNKPQDALTALSPIMDRDPAAQLGAAWAMLQMAKPNDAATLLQELWNNNPTGLFAFQVAQLARTSNIKLQDPAISQELVELLRKLPPNSMSAHRQPRDLELVSASLDQRNFDIGDPIILHVKLKNTSGRAQSVGPDGVIKSHVGVTAEILGVANTQFTYFALDDLQRRFRIEDGEDMRSDIRVDQGPVKVALDADLVPLRTMRLSITTAPRLDARNPGLGGQTLELGDFDRRGLKIDSNDDYAKLAAEADSLPLDQRMQRLRFCAAYLPALTVSPQDKDADVIALKQRLFAALQQPLVNAAKSDSALLRAWVVRVMGISHGDEQFDYLLSQMAHDPEPLARMFWAKRIQVMIGSQLTDSGPLMDTLKKAADEEKDPNVQRWMRALIADAATERAAPALPRPGGAKNDQPERSHDVAPSTPDTARPRDFGNP